VFKKLLIGATAASVVAGAGLVQAQAARDYIFIVGSSTVYPFTTAVAEQFGRGGKFKTPKVESTGTGGGLKLFCAGVGPQHPDVANASRRIKAAEVDTCAKNGVKDILEVKIGFDGIVLANAKSAPGFSLTRKDLFMALAKKVPDPANPSSLMDNPYKTWKDVNPSLPSEKIEVLGPPPTSGTRDAFAELVMENGCSSFAWIKELKEVDEKRFKAVCDGIREDGAYIEAGENDNVIVQKLVASPAAVGIFGYSFLEENLNKIKGATVEGVVPTFDTIASAKYPVSRALYFYVKKAHVGVIPGLTEFVQEYTSDKAFGSEGYLADKGLIPLPASDQKKVRADATAMKNLKL
jgi:phosphate transport system substrate-binding protein